MGKCKRAARATQVRWWKRRREDGREGGGQRSRGRASVEEGGGGNQSAREALGRDAGTETGRQVDGMQFCVSIDYDAKIGVGKYWEKEEGKEEEEEVYRYR